VKIRGRSREGRLLDKRSGGETVVQRWGLGSLGSTRASKRYGWWRWWDGLGDIAKAMSNHPDVYLALSLLCTLCVGERAWVLDKIQKII
jgi:hypothetical protein